MKKLLKISISPILLTPLVGLTLSCSTSGPSDYKTMIWSIDPKKVDEIKQSNWNAFNMEVNTWEKLKKVIKGDKVNPDRYTNEAFQQGWFKKIEFEQKDGKPTKLVIELLNEKTIPNSSDPSKNKVIKNIYRLPNGKLKYEY